MREKSVIGYPVFTYLVLMLYGRVEDVWGDPSNRNQPGFPSHDAGGDETAQKNRTISQMMKQNTNGIKKTSHRVPSTSRVTRSRRKHRLSGGSGASERGDGSAWIDSELDSELENSLVQLLSEVRRSRRLPPHRSLSGGGRCKQSSWDATNIQEQSVSCPISQPVILACFGSVVVLMILV